MIRVSCPGCGAEVSFRNPASVVAVCSYCHTLVGKTADAVKNLGKISEVLEDFSLLQIGTTGKFDRKNFSVVGRIQMRYERGLWSEWYLYFDDGSTAWLSDFNGLFALTLPQESLPDAPDFETLTPLHRLQCNGRSWVATDIRTAQCIAGQGELPFEVGQGWSAQVADFRHRDRFLTLDYSQAPPPSLHVGRIVEASELHLQLTRDVTALGDPAGRYKGAIQSLNCPSCGSPVSFRAALAPHVVCGTCQSSIDCSGDRAVVLEAAQRLEVLEQGNALKLGQKCTFSGQRYELIGILRRGVPGSPEADHWHEYLLLGDSSLRWLVFAPESGWTLFQPATTWPDLSPSGAQLSDSSGTFHLTDTYRAETVFAIGAFNWRVHVGDTVSVREYARDDKCISIETDEHEASCSRGVSLTSAQVAESFGIPENTLPSEAHPPGFRHTAAGPAASARAHLGYYAVASFTLLALPALLMGLTQGFGTFLPLLVAGALGAGLVYTPANNGLATTTAKSFYVIYALIVGGLSLWLLYSIATNRFERGSSPSSRSWPTSGTSSGGSYRGGGSHK